MRCPSCPKRGRQQTEGADDEDPIVNVVEHLIRERDSGFGFPSDLSELEKELVMVWDETRAAYERGLQLRVALSLEALIRNAGPA